MSDNPLQVARLHVAKGEEILARAEESTEPMTVVKLDVAMATAHFTAAMAITNIELTVEPDLG